MEPCGVRARSQRMHTPPDWYAAPPVAFEYTLQRAGLKLPALALTVLSKVLAAVAIWGVWKAPPAFRGTTLKPELERRADSAATAAAPPEIAT